MYRWANGFQCCYMQVNVSVIILNKNVQDKSKLIYKIPFCDIDTMIKIVNLFLKKNSFYNTVL